MLKLCFHKILAALRRHFLHLRLQPIRVFVFHQVSVEFDASTMWECDWTEIEQFKRYVLKLKQRYTFVSLPEAYRLLSLSLLPLAFRLKRYAVLTCDDGWASILSVLPWLHEQQIPVTLFLNPAYLLQQEVRENGMSKLLTMEQVRELLHRYPSITIAAHGWNHDNCSLQTDADFCKNVDNCIRYLEGEKGYIPFFAYPCGRHTVWQDEYLIHKNIIPVYCDGQKNYNNINFIHRECIDYETLRNHPLL